MFLTKETKDSLDQIKRSSKLHYMTVGTLVGSKTQSTQAFKKTYGDKLVAVGSETIFYGEPNGTP